MDAEKVDKLAKSLKESHFAANMEEAIEKAKQILEQGNPEKDLKTVNELFNEEERAAKLAEETKEDAEEVKSEIIEEEKETSQEGEEIRKIEQEIDEDRETVEEIKEDLEEE